jgi:hypothetical protein
MTPRHPVAVARNFHLPDLPGGRLLVADGAGWRKPSAEEMAVVQPADEPVLLFALAGHLRASFWAMLEQGETGNHFDAFAAAVGHFLTFKQLPPPERAVFELVLHGPEGGVEPQGLWAVVNLDDDAVVVGVPGLRVRLGAGEGVQFPEGVAAEVLRPAGEGPDVLLLVRRPGS